jgi:hypothetical protein
MEIESIPTPSGNSAATRLPDVVGADLAKIEVDRRFAGDLEFYVGILRPKLTFHPVRFRPQRGDKGLDALCAASLRTYDDQAPAIVSGKQGIRPIETRDGARHARHGAQRSGQEAQRVGAFRGIQIGNAGDHQN